MCSRLPVYAPECMRSAYQKQPRAPIRAWRLSFRKNGLRPRSNGDLQAKAGARKPGFGTGGLRRTGHPAPGRFPRLRDWGSRLGTRPKTRVDTRAPAIEKADHRCTVIGHFCCSRVARPRSRIPASQSRIAGLPLSYSYPASRNLPWALPAPAPSR